MDEDELDAEKTKNKMEINEEALKNNLLDYENIGEFFEKDARRYRRYLGDDLLKEQFIWVQT